MIMPSIIEFAKYIAETYVKPLECNSEDTLELSLVIAFDLIHCAKDMTITEELTHYVCENTLKNSSHRLHSFRKTVDREYYKALICERGDE